MKLTKAQQTQVDNLKRFGPLTVGAHTPGLVRIFKALEKKGIVKAACRTDFYTTYELN
ncbi:MAG TPA: hypothetical protein VEC96_07855 [Anaerolineae bacterium]|nr:hypothetical protein [Anaerolineae bacterium]